MPCCEISDRAQMSKTIIAVRHFALGGRESLETAVSVLELHGETGAFSIIFSSTSIIKSIWL